MTIVHDPDNAEVHLYSDTSAPSRTQRQQMTDSERNSSPTLVETPSPTKGTEQRGASRHTNTKGKMEQTTGHTDIDVHERRNVNDKGNLNGQRDAGQKNETTVIDPKGNATMILDVPGVSLCHFKCSVLALRTLGGAFTPRPIGADPPTAWESVITLDVTKGAQIPDSKDNMGIILSVAHLHFNQLPESRTFEQFPSLVDLAVELDVLRIMRRFLREWAHPLVLELQLIDLPSPLWLNIAWHMQYSSIFEANSSVLY